MKTAVKDNRKLIAMSKPHRIEVSIYLNQQQVDKIKISLIPKTMEDKWFIYFEDNWIYLHRSWTGNLLYKSQIHQIDIDKYEIRDFWVERDLERYRHTNDESDIYSFKHHIHHLANREIRNHIRNSILGLVAGDALGVPAEFKSRLELKKNPIVDMIGFGTHHQPVGTWSDDSSLALCLADELIKEFNLNYIGESFVKWLYENHWTPHGEVFDIGISTQQAINRLKNGEIPDLAGGWDENSNGNGSLMRILPLLFHTRYITKDVERYDIIKQVSSITHAHVRSCLACYYYLEFASFICSGEHPNYAYKIANASFKNLTKELEIDQDEIAKFNRLLNGNINELSENEIQSTGYVIHTLEASIWCILTTNSYKDAVLKAVNLGEDTDTTGAVTGGLAGLIYTADAIPNDWLNKIVRINDIEELISKFTEKYKEAGR